MIGLTNALCKHCAPICYWQTLNYWPRCQSSMNANKMLCKSRFFISDANAIFIYDANVPCRDEMQNLFMMMLVRTFKLWCKCLLTKMEMRQSSNGYVTMQMFWCKCPFWVCNDASAPLWVCNDTNALLWVCNDADAPLMHAIMRMSA